MMWLADIKIALHSLKATRMRTLLTILGIIIGIAAVTTVLALGEGAKQTLQNQLTQFGGDVVTVRPGKLSKDSKGEISGYDFFANFNASTLTESDVKVISSTPGVAYTAPIMGVRGSVSGSERTTDNAQIIATNHDMATVLGQDVKVGEFVNEELNRNTVVLGSALANELLGSDQTIGQQVDIRGEKYTLIGVLNQTEIPLAVNGLYDSNHAAYVTLEAGKALNQGVAHIQTINFRIAPGANSQEVISKVSQRLREAHKADDTAVIGSSEALAITNKLFSQFTFYVAAVASISLLVGGIGVMNIMLVAVSERTREIGVRKAVGATNGQIMRQFLTESAIMSLTGGLLGLLLSYIFTLVISWNFQFNAAFTWSIVGWSLLVSLVIGIIFGMFPAIRAARKDPIVALRRLH